MPLSTAATPPSSATASCNVMAIVPRDSLPPLTEPSKDIKDFIRENNYPRIDEAGVVSFPPVLRTLLSSEDLGARQIGWQIVNHFIQEQFNSIINKKQLSGQLLPGLRLLGLFNPMAPLERESAIGNLIGDCKQMLACCEDLFSSLCDVLCKSNARLVIRSSDMSNIQVVGEKAKEKIKSQLVWLRLFGEIDRDGNVIDGTEQDKENLKVNLLRDFVGRSAAISMRIVSFNWLEHDLRAKIDEGPKLIEETKDTVHSKTHWPILLLGGIYTLTCIAAMIAGAVPAWTLLITVAMNVALLLAFFIEPYLTSSVLDNFEVVLKHFCAQLNTIKSQVIALLELQTELENKVIEENIPPAEDIQLLEEIATAVVALRQAVQEIFSKPKVKHQSGTSCLVG